MPSKAETKKLLFAEIDALAPADLFKLASVPVKLNETIEKSRDSEREERKFNAKVVAAMKRRYVERLNAREIPLDTTFAKYFEQNAGGKCPGRVQSLAGLFNSLVLTNDAEGKPLLSESLYDTAALDWLEKANAIVNAAQKKHGEQWKSCDEVKDAITALSTPGDAAEALDKIRVKQKGTDTPAAETDAGSVTLTAERAVEFLIAFAGDALKAVAAKPGNAKELFFAHNALTTRLNDVMEAMDKITDAYQATHSKETVQQWLKDHNKGVADNVTVIRSAPAETPAPAPAATEPVADAPAETPVAETETAAA